MEIERINHNRDVVTYRIFGKIGKQYVEARTHHFFWEEAQPVLYHDWVPSQLMQYARRYPDGPGEGFKEATRSQNNKMQKILARRISRDIPERLFRAQERRGIPPFPKRRD